MTKNSPGNADKRFNYVKYSELTKEDQNIARNLYTNVVAWIPHEEYLYPVKINGRLARSARRYGPGIQRATELKEAYDKRNKK